MQTSPKLIGLLQALGLLTYIALLALSVITLSSWVRPIDTPSSPLPIIIFLLTFVTSALICSAIAFAYPIRLSMQGKKETAMQVVLSTILWLLAIGAVFLVFVILR